ncbi:hypothetical protein IR083_19800 [Dysgonomonas sp. GY75]|uniref:hypothetical protein n=1 Tax=Dysgonomonas sp. GY75 TaxID=2780419 RepID=UPI0018844E21|nr:hypothetical protein [Dysgonomonas sp. GY75]MBF0651064.1 hypothetical protein [Dysgonomonas sp. GY75]
MEQINLNYSEISVGIVALAGFLLSTFFIGKWWPKFRSRRWIVTAFWGVLTAWCVIVDGERMKETASIIVVSCGAAQSIIFILATTFEHLKINIGSNLSIEADNKTGKEGKDGNKKTAA